MFDQNNYEGMLKSNETRIKLQFSVIVWFDPLFFANIDTDLYTNSDVLQKVIVKYVDTYFFFNKTFYK